MTDHEYKLIEQGRDNEMLALLEWIRQKSNLSVAYECWFNEEEDYVRDAELLERFKNRDK